MDTEYTLIPLKKYLKFSQGFFCKKDNTKLKN